MLFSMFIVGCRHMDGRQGLDGQVRDVGSVDVHVGHV